MITGIGELVTCDGTGAETGSDGATTTAAGRRTDGVVAGSDRPSHAPAADRRVDLDGRTLLPGFVDSHSHLVFAGDRSAEFAARMTGTAVRRRWHRHHRRPPPAPPPTTSCALLVGAGSRRCGPGHDDRRDQERLRAERGRRDPGAADRGGVHRRDDLPRRARRAAGVAGRPRRLPRPGHRRRCSAAATTVRPLDRRLLRAGVAVRVRPATRRGACWRPGGRPVWSCGCTATSSVRAPVSSWRSSSGAASVDHCTYLSDADVDALVDAADHHRGDPAARRRVLHPVALPGRVAGCSTPGVVDRPGHRLQPGHLLLLLDAVHDRAGGSGDGDDAGGGPLRGDRRARPVPCVAATSAGSPSAARPTSPCWTHRPSPTWPTDPGFRSCGPSTSRHRSRPESLCHIAGAWSTWAGCW